MQNGYDLRERTKKFALRILTMYTTLPQSTQAQVLGKQVLRSGTSVGANYREAARGGSKAELIAKMGDCLKELDETQYGFELLIESGIVAEEQLANLAGEAKELTAIFVTIITKAKQNSD